MSDDSTQERLIAQAVTEVDRSLLAWYRELSMLERLRAASKAAAMLERLRAASTKR